MNQDDIYNEMKKLADQHCVDLTDNAVNIAKFRARANVPLSVCPCCRGDTSRYCISYQCLRDIEILGKCHCQAFRRRDV